ncbi:hypothetical protein LCGC14_2744620 [marine sediment metagenome]|uniref:Uncharacterized protein n=1 Tax=marine sediment metagenome TaxID=412755 RepID=A0A0F8V9M2_9ZZZZ
MNFEIELIILKAQNIINALQDISDDEIPESRVKKIKKAIEESYEKFKKAIEKMTILGITSVEVGYTIKDIPIIGKIFNFTVSLKAVEK